MIAVTRLDGTSVVVNIDLVERIEQTPDTLVVMIGGERMLVRETPGELVRRATVFKRSVFAGIGPDDESAGRPAGDGA